MKKITILSKLIFFIITVLVFGINLSVAASIIRIQESLTYLTDEGLSEKQFLALKHKVTSGKASIDEAYLYMNEAEGRESWEIRKNLAPYIKLFPIPSVSKKVFFIHLRLMDEPDTSYFHKIRLAKNLLLPDFSRHENFQSELILFKNAVQLSVQLLDGSLDTNLFVKYFEDLMPTYKSTGKFVLLLQLEDKNALLNQMQDSLTAKALFGERACHLLPYLFAGHMADKHALKKEEWRMFISKLPKDSSNGNSLSYLFKESENIAEKSLKRME